MSTFSRRQLFATIGGAAALAADHSLSAQARPARSQPVEEYRRIWLNPQKQFPHQAPPLAALNFYGLIATVTEGGRPKGALFVNGDNTANTHVAWLHIAKANYVTGSGPAFDWQDANYGAWKITGRRMRAASTGTIPAAQVAAFRSSNDNPWSDLRWLPKINSLAGGLRPKPTVDILSSKCGTAFFEFVGGEVEPSVPWASAGQKALFGFRGAPSTKPFALTDNITTLMPLPVGAALDLLSKPLDQPNLTEIVFAKLKLSPNGMLPIFFSNDTPAPTNMGSGTIHHSKAYWNLVQNPPAGANAWLPEFVAGMGGEASIPNLRGMNNGDPICNGCVIDL